MAIEGSTVRSGYGSGMRTLVQTCRPRRRSLLWILAAFTILAAACSDDPALTTAIDDADAPLTDDEPDGEGGEADPPADGDDQEADPDPDPEPDPPSGGSDSSAYCALAAENDAAFNSFNFLTATPAEVEAFFTERQSSLAQAVAVAPDVIRADLSQFAAQYDLFVATLADNGWVFLDAQADLEALETPEMDAVDERREAYDRDVCGIDDDVAPPVDPSSGAANPFGENPAALEALLQSEFGRTTIIESMTAGGTLNAEEAGCLLDNLDVALLFQISFGEGDLQGAGLSDFLAAFDTCGISPDQFG